MTTRASLYQARYGSPDVAVPAAGSTLIDHLLAHRSVRAYLPDPVNDHQLAAIVDGHAVHFVGRGGTDDFVDAAAFGVEQTDRASRGIG